MAKTTKRNKYQADERRKQRRTAGVKPVLPGANPPDPLSADPNIEHVHGMSGDRGPSGSHGGAGGMGGSRGGKGANQGGQGDAGGIGGKPLGK